MNSQHYNPELLKELREDRKLKQEQVAGKIGVDRQTVYRAETGRSASYELLCSLAELYEVDVVSLLHPRRIASVSPEKIFLTA